MLLTLSASSLKSALLPGGRKKPTMTLLDVPRHTREVLGLHGLNVSTDLLVGAGRETLEGLRDAADKARCACLLLSETSPLPVGDADDDTSNSATERLMRVVQAASLLGCNAASVAVQGKNDDGVFERTVDSLRHVMETAEKLELNLLVSPTAGLTSDPERVTEIIKKVGGFRMHTLPDFEQATKESDPVAYLRRLTPYASVVTAATNSFKATSLNDGGIAGTQLDNEGDPLPLLDEPVIHESYDVQPLVSALVSVGYDGTLAIDYRGKGDVTLGIMRSRAVLEDALEKELSK